MKTIGALSLPRPASSDEATCPPFTGCCSPAPRQRPPVMRLIPIHNIVCFPHILIYISETLYEAWSSRHQPVYPAHETNSIRASVTSNSNRLFFSGSFSFPQDSPLFDRSMIDVGATQQYVPKKSLVYISCYKRRLVVTSPRNEYIGLPNWMINNISVSHSQIHHQT